MYKDIFSALQISKDYIASLYFQYSKGFVSQHALRDKKHLAI